MWRLRMYLFVSPVAVSAALSSVNVANPYPLLRGGTNVRSCTTGWGEGGVGWGRSGAGEMWWFFRTPHALYTWDTTPPVCNSRKNLISCSLAS